jgi:hypothetical protein
MTLPLFRMLILKLTSDLCLQLILMIFVFAGIIFGCISSYESSLEECFEDVTYDESGISLITDSLRFVYVDVHIDFILLVSEKVGVSAFHLVKLIGYERLTNLYLVLIEGLLKC